jgi:primosomal protein N' (replication factor Y)
MIAKGLHFEDVTLVGVLGIDTTLNLPDFRASERTFQLITQVAGRAGRSQKPGLVIVQTFQPDHPAIEHAINHDFTSYYEEEITYRRQLFYPPFASLINLIITSKNEAELQQYCETLSTFLTAKTTDLAEQLKIIGPKPAPFEKIKDYYRYNVLLKCQPEIIPEIKQILSHLPQKKLTTRIILDFDPKSIL